MSIMKKYTQARGIDQWSEEHRSAFLMRALMHVPNASVAFNL